MVGQREGGVSSLPGPIRDLELGLNPSFYRRHDNVNLADRKLERVYRDYMTHISNVDPRCRPLRCRESLPPSEGGILDLRR